MGDLIVAKLQWAVRHQTFLHFETGEMILLEQLQALLQLAVGTL